MGKGRSYRSDKISGAAASDRQIARPCRGKADHCKDSQRPPLLKKQTCSHCGSDRIESKGSNIKCKDCSRHSRKIRRLDTILPSRRPSCPECGTSEPYSQGKKNGERVYVCKECGRMFNGKYRKINIDEFLALEVQVE